ncbi:MAG TPA: S41 family peptidase [Phycisphaerales bacterium]|nr:S41 family peptidase [Phycisphaerales bacterium]
MKKSSRLGFQIGLLAILGVAVLGSTLRISQMGDDYTFFDPLVEVKHLLSHRAFEKPDEEALQNGAINGLVEAVGDPFTVYVPAVDSQDFEKELIGEYVGIGAQVNIEEGYLTIVTPLDGSPALKAGIRAGDKIVEIEAESTLGKSVDECVDMLMGEPGVPVDVTVEREGERFGVTITRERINTVQVKGIHRLGENEWQFMLDPERKIGYIWLTQFTPGCADEVKAALESLHAAEGGLNGLIFDLRWNPGGVLGEAVQLVDMFVEEGVIVSTRGREGDETVDRAHKAGTLPDFPMIVLLNEFSASASEVFAGALVDHDRAIVLGTRSVGKGSVQSVIPIPSEPGAVLKITDRNYFLPSGKSIQKKDDSVEWGVDPTQGFYVPMSQEQTIEVIRRRQEEDVIRQAAERAEEAQNGAEGAAFADPSWIEENMKDVQLAAAVRAIQARVEKGEWLAPGNDQPVADLAAGAELGRLVEARDQILLELERMQRRVEALESGTGVAAEELTPDLWGDDVAVEGGTVEVRDAEGKVVAELKITNPGLERWLVGAGVEKAGGDAENEEGD